MSYKKRLTKIENRLNPEELPTAWIARIKSNGRVILSHNDSEDIQLPNVEALYEWEREKGGLPAIKIEYVRPEGYENQ